MKQHLTKSNAATGAPRPTLDLNSGPLADVAPRTPFWKGSTLGVQGEPSNSLYIIARGQVLLSRTNARGETHALYLLGPGDLFGEGALQPERTWMVTARAVTDGEFHVVRAAQMPRLAQYHPQLTAHVLGLITSRLERSHSRVELLSVNSARERVLGLLRALGDHHGEPHGAEVWLPVSLTQAELGEMLGLSRETVARVLAELRSEGVLRRGDRRGMWMRKASTLAVPGAALLLPSLSSLVEWVGSTPWC
jgi:CRP-like cAMP-binding protein